MIQHAKTTIWWHFIETTTDFQQLLMMGWDLHPSLTLNPLRYQGVLFGEARNQGRIGMRTTTVAINSSLLRTCDEAGEVVSRFQSNCTDKKWSDFTLETWQTPIKAEHESYICDLSVLKMCSVIFQFSDTELFSSTRHPRWVLSLLDRRWISALNVKRCF